MSSEAANPIPPFFFLHRAYYLLSIFSARGHSKVGLKFGDGVLEVTRHLLVFFLFIKGLMLVHCLHPLLFGCSKKNKTEVKKFSHFVISSIVEDVISFAGQTFQNTRVFWYSFEYSDI